MGAKQVAGTEHHVKLELTPKSKCILLSTMIYQMPNILRYKDKIFSTLQYLQFGEMENQMKPTVIQSENSYACKSLKH